MGVLTLQQPAIVESFRDVDVSVSQRPLASGSLDVSSKYNHLLEKWTIAEDKDSFAALQKTIGVWEKDGIRQYLVYGKNGSAKWEIVPFHKPWTIVFRFWNQFSVLIRTVFGRFSQSPASIKQQQAKYKAAFQDYVPTPISDKIQNIAQDAFCKEATVNKQRVFEGKTVNILYNYAPIGFGGERLHFLIVPKLHKEKFSQLSEEEYVEACALSRKLISRLGETRSIEDVHLYHKTGVDAGQTVPHWHMHVVVISNKTQGFFGKWTVLKNMLIGSSPMKEDAQRTKVKALQEELDGLNGHLLSRFIERLAG